MSRWSTMSNLVPPQQQPRSNADELPLKINSKQGESPDASDHQSFLAMTIDILKPFVLPAMIMGNLLVFAFIRLNDHLVDSIASSSSSNQGIRVVEVNGPRNNDVARSGRPHHRHPSGFVPLDDTLSESERDLLFYLSDSGEGRKRVNDMLIHELVSETALYTDPEDLLESAVSALVLMETDSEPVEIEGFPFLFVGSVGAAMNEESLQEQGITHIVNWSSTAKCNIFPEIDYLCIHGVKSGRQMMKYLDQAVEYVEEARKSNGKALSHCWHGKNRSVTLLIAYLMKYQGMEPHEANRIIKRTRPQARPYYDTLEEYSEFLKMESDQRRRDEGYSRSKLSR